MVARALNRLTARTVQTMRKPGRHADGGGLYLSISPDGSRRRWVFVFRWRQPGQPGPGRLREMGLGSATTVSLAKARELAGRARSVLADGRNPLDEKQARRAIPTFGEMTEEVIASLETGWRNPKHRDQWRQTLAAHCKPIRDLPVDAVTTDHVRRHPEAALVEDPGDRLAAAWPHREDSRCREGQGAPLGREPGAVARSSRSPPAEAPEAHARAP